VRYASSINGKAGWTSNEDHSFFIPAIQMLDPFHSFGVGDLAKVGREGRDAAFFVI
jgi:hypothetical protein